MAEATEGTAPSASATPAQAPVAPQTAPAAPPQPASEPDKGNAQGAGKPLTAPLVKDPMALLNRFRERTGIAKPSESAKPAVAPTNETTPTPGADGKTSSVPQPGQGNAGSSDSNASTTSKTPESSDDLAARVAKFNRTEREFAQRQAAFEQEKARLKAEGEATAKANAEKLRQAEVVDMATKAIEAGDIAGAFKALKADVNPSALALQLLEQLQREDERPMSPAEVERMVAEKLKAENEARAKAEEERRKQDEEKQKAAAAQTLEGARENYMQACAGLFSADKHPFIAQHGLPRDAVISYAESQKDEFGRMMPPEPGELLNYFETLYRTRAERAGWAPKTVEAPKPAPSPSLNPSSLVQDQGSRLISPGPAKKLEEKRAEIRARLRIAGRQT